MKACPSCVRLVSNLLPFLHHCPIREPLRRCFRIFAKESAAIANAEQNHTPTPSRSSSSSARSRKRLQFKDPSVVEAEAKAKYKASFKPLFLMAEGIPISQDPSASAEQSVVQVASLLDSIHLLDFILRTCSATAPEDPIAFTQLLTKLHRAIGSVVSLCQSEVQMLRR